MPHLVRFDRFEVDLESGQLRSRGTKIKLRDQSFQVLATLLEHPGSVVTREQLRQRLWHNQVFVDFDNNLNIVVARLREALGDSADHPHYVETLPKRGYRFLGVVDSLPPKTDVSKARARLLVLPFVNLCGDPSQEYFIDAITDEIITDLASLAPQQLAVIARTTAMLYKVRPRDIAAIGRELDVDFVIEGSVRREENRVGLNVQLVQVADQTHLFAKKYDATINQLFTLQNDIAHEFASHIPPITDRIAEAHTVRKHQPTANLAAYHEYIQGRFQTMKTTVQSVTEAKQHLQRALALDPDFALAHDALADCYWHLGYAGFVSPREAFTAGIGHALRAIEIDNSLAETHALLAEFHKTLYYDWSEVHREMDLARQLDPDSPLVRRRYAVSELMPHGRLEESLTELDRALERDPFSSMIHTWRGIVLVLSRRFDETLAEGNKLLELEPDSYLAHFIISHGYRYQQRYAEALAAQRRAVELSGGAPWMLGWLGLTLAVSGNGTEAHALLRRLHSTAAKSYVPPSSFAWIHLGLKELDPAFEWLNRAADECDQLMMPIKSYAFFDPIRSDSRFPGLLRKMNLLP